MPAESSTSQAQPARIGPAWRNHAVIAAAALISHFMAFGRGFVWDDVKTINYLNSIGRWAVARPDPFGFIRPGKIFMFSALHALFAERVWLYEAAAMIALIVTGIVLFGLLRRWLSERAALAACLIYVCHPHHVETTFWISALNGGLLTLFAIIYYRGVLRWNERLSLFPHAVLALVYLAALSMKEEAVILPLIAAVMLLSLGRLPSRGFVVASFLLWVVSLAFVLYARMVAKEVGQTLDASAPDWVLTACAPRTILSHFLYFVFPFRWGYYLAFSIEAFTLYGLMALGWIAAFAFAAWVVRGDGLRDPRRLGLVVAVAAMLPLCNLVPLKNNWFAVRYLSHSGMGLALCAGGFLDWGRAFAGGRGRMALPVLAAWLLCAAAASNVFHTSWTTSDEFFSRTLQEQRKPVFLSLLANIRLSQDRPEEALALAEESIAFDPSRAVNHVTRGIALLRIGKPDEALAAWKHAEQLAPGDVDNSIQLAYFYDARHEKNHDPADRDLADHYYRIASAGGTPNSAVAFANRGLLWMMDGNYEKAVAIWEEGNRRFPAYEGIRTNLERARRDPRAGGGERK